VMGSGSLPTTGAAFDLLFVFASGGLSAAGALAQRKIA
jgi:hypothetical protein